MKSSGHRKKTLAWIGFLSAWSWMAASAQEPKTGSVVLRWLPAKTAVKYELQIASDRAFRNLLLEKTVHSTWFRWHNLPSSNAYWRVRGIDQNARQGKWSTTEVIQALIVPPRPLSPPQGKNIQIDKPGAWIEFAWKPIQHAQGYLIEISGDIKFRKILFKRQTIQTKMIFTPPVTGRYYWRVRSLFSQSTRSGFSPPRYFRLMPIAPKPIEPKPNDRLSVGEAIRFRWNRIPVANGYLFQIASDRSFQKIIFKSHPVKNTISWTPANPGKYFYRVASLDALKYPGRRSIARPLFVLPTPDLPALAAPVLDEPLPNAVFQPKPQSTDSELKTDFSWLAVTQANEYELALSTSKQFDIDLQKNRMTTNQTQVTLPVGKTYYWKVRAWRLGDRGAQPGEWSEARAFLINQPDQPEPIEVTEQAVRPIPPPPSRATTMHVGASLGLVSNFGEVTTGRVDIEIGFHLSSDLELDISGGYFTSELSISDEDGLRVDSRLHAIPIKLLLAFYLLNRQDFRIYMGGGLQLNLSHASVSLPSSPGFTETDLQYGFVAATGAEIPIGPGRAYIEIDYSLSSTSSGRVEVNTGGLFAVLGYRWDLW